MVGWRSSGPCTVDATSSACTSGLIQTLDSRAFGESDHQINKLVFRFSRRMGTIRQHRNTSQAYAPGERRTGEKGQSIFVVACRCRPYAATRVFLVSGPTHAPHRLHYRFRRTAPRDAARQSAPAGVLRRRGGRNGTHGAAPAPIWPGATTAGAGGTSAGKNRDSVCWSSHATDWRIFGWPPYEAPPTRSPVGRQMA